MVTRSRAATTAFFVSLAVSLLLVAAGMVDHQMLGVLIALALATFVAFYLRLVWEYILRIDSHRRSRAMYGYEVLVRLQTTKAIREHYLRIAGVPGSGRAFEYHIVARDAEGASVVRSLIHDLTLLSQTADAPSVHVFSWKGSNVSMTRRILEKVAARGDRFRVWQEGEFTCGVVSRIVPPKRDAASD